MKIFYQLLANNIIATVTNYTVWFAITFYAYLETKSVFVTSMIAGIYLVMTTASGFWFGSLVDHHKKKQVMIWSSFFSLLIYILCFAIYITAAPNEFKSVSSVRLWILIPLLLLGVIAGNIRNIALPTIVTFLFPEDKRDKANGLVGTASGVAFLVVSVISGFLVGFAGMYWVLILAITLTIVTLLHLWFISIPEKPTEHHEEENNTIDIKGTFKVISAVPGLFALILFTTFNNFLGGVFMSLMDAYGLSMVSVQVWGVMWGFLSTAFIIGGSIIAKFGLGKNPLKSLFLANTVIWAICSVFTIYPSIIPLIMGMFTYLCVVPYIQASEQTILQKVVPKNRQGRVFGFAQSVEQAASPLTAFMIGPLTEFIFIPFMTTGAGVELIGDWFGTGKARGIALVFIITGIIGLCITLVGWSSKYYKQLSQKYLSS